MNWWKVIGCWLIATAIGVLIGIVFNVQNPTMNILLGFAFGLTGFVIGMLIQ